MHFEVVLVGRPIALRCFAGEKEFAFRTHERAGKIDHIWHPSGADHLGFIAQDSAEPIRAAVEAKTPVPCPTRPSVKYLGGWFCELGHPDDKPA